MMGVLVIAPFVGPTADYAQVSDSSRSNGMENGLTPIVDKIQEEVADLVQDSQDNIEDAVDNHIDEDEVADGISDLSEDNVIDAIDNDDVSVDAAVTEAAVRELEEPDEDTMEEDGTEIAATSEVEDLQQQIQDLQSQIARLNAIIYSLTPSSSNSQTAPRSQTMNSTG